MEHKTDSESISPEKTENSKHIHEALKSRYEADRARHLAAKERATHVKEWISVVKEGITCVSIFVGILIAVQKFRA